jgi:hypothetical protein
MTKAATKKTNDIVTKAVALGEKKERAKTISVLEHLAAHFRGFGLLSLPLETAIRTLRNGGPRKGPQKAKSR